MSAVHRAAGPTGKTKVRSERTSTRVLGPVRSRRSTPAAPPPGPRTRRRSPGSWSGRPPAPGARRAREVHAQQHPAPLQVDRDRMVGLAGLVGGGEVEGEPGDGVGLGPVAVGGRVEPGGDRRFARQARHRLRRAGGGHRLGLGQGLGGAGHVLVEHRLRAEGDQPLVVDHHVLQPRLPQLLARIGAVADVEGGLGEAVAAGQQAHGGRRRHVGRDDHQREEGLLPGVDGGGRRRWAGSGRWWAWSTRGGRRPARTSRRRGGARRPGRRRPARGRGAGRGPGPSGTWTAASASPGGPASARAPPGAGEGAGRRRARWWRRSTPRPSTTGRGSSTTGRGTNRVLPAWPREGRWGARPPLQHGPRTGQKMRTS